MAKVSAGTHLKQSVPILGSSVDAMPLSSSKVSPVRRFEREMGFGDFCLGPRPYQSSIPDSKSPIGKVTAKLPVPPPFNGFFLYEKLPREIRQNILNFLVSPFLTPSPPARSTAVHSPSVKTPAVLRLDLSLFSSEEDDENSPFNRVDDLTFRAFGGYDSPSRTQRMVEWENYLKEQEELSDEDLDCWTEYNVPHPEREDKPYTLKVLVSESSDDAQAQNLDLLRNISNVSTRIRYELGSVLFSNIELNCHMALREFSSGILQDFLDARPALCRKIKSLNLELNCCHQNTRGELQSTFYYLAAALKLNKLNIKLTMLPNHIKKMKHNDAYFEQFKSFSLLNVKV